jgi:23S rRNA C2498 (ribose-2'-O)-methylase RlmM
MSDDLHANNPDLPSFHMSMGIWPHLLEQSGAYFTCLIKGARWYTLHDERMTTHYHLNEDDQVEKIVAEYPAILCQCGSFEVTEEEAKVLARIARNYAAIQRTLKEPPEEEWGKLMMMPAYERPVVSWIRRDWVDIYENFAEWAEQSRGFTIH